MSAPTRADENLLFGILALQMNFVDRDDLISAMHAWVLDKAKPLSRIFLEQQALNAEEYDLLQALVQKHIQKHGGDVQKSLATISAVGSVREELHEVADAEFHTSLAQIGTAAEVADPYATRDASAAVPNPSGPRFRVLRPHAKGGLGEVFVARDTELHREVALKEIQNRHADDPSSRTRFVLEAEITGGLEHPGIVPVYGLGQYADGRPYYAMRFIRGDSLYEAIQRFHRAEPAERAVGKRGLVLRQLLTRFVAVCNAIAYAHSRGVLHRDLKPQNIMLGPYGETLVVDWGLAKPQGEAALPETCPEPPLHPLSADSAEPTRMGSVLGTPAFMPPEQAAGRLDLLGPASDVYSLGATLYCLLTGKAPFTGQDNGDVLRKVQRGEFPRLREVVRNVPPALEAVCLKAMALQPEQRYTGARALAEDIERWLADEPVRAWREPLRLRLGRWTRRHQTLVAAATAALLVALLAAGSGLWWLDRQRTEQRRGVEAAFVEIARLKMAGHWSEARAVLRQTETRLGQSGPRDLHERLQQAERELDLVARLDAIRMKRATWVESVLDKKSADREYEQALREAGMVEVGGEVEAAASWVVNVEVREALVAALDDWAGCVEDHERCTWLLKVARRADPDPWREAARRAAEQSDAAALTRLAKDERAIGQPAQLLVMLAEVMKSQSGVAEGLLRAAQERHPNDFWVNFSLGNVLVHLKPEEAIGYYRTALALRPGTIGVYNNLGLALRNKDRLDEAAAAYRKAIELDPEFALAYLNLGDVLRDQRQWDKAIAAYRKPIALHFKKDLAYFGLGYALYNLGRLDEAIEAYRKAIEFNPQNIGSHNNLALTLSDKGQLEEAIAEYRKALELNPKFTLAHANLGILLRRTGRLEEAIAEFQKVLRLDPKNSSAAYYLGKSLWVQGRRAEAIAAYRKTIELNPGSSEAHHSLASALSANKQFEEAITAYRKAIELNPKDAAGYYQLGLILRMKNRLDEAQAALRKAIEVNPKDSLYHISLGNVLYDTRQFDEAIAQYHQAIELNPQSASTHYNLANALHSKGRSEEAIVSYQKSIELNPEYANAHNGLGIALKAKGRLDEAIVAYRKATELNPKDSILHYNLGLALQAKGRLDEAITEYGLAIELDVKYASAYYNLGSALQAKHQFDEAIAAYHKTIALNPNFVQAHNNLGNALRVKGRLEEALAAYRKAIALDPKYDAAYDNLGLVLRAKDRLEEAVAQHRKALELNPKNDSAWFNLGYALVEIGQLDEGIAAYRKTTELKPEDDFALNNLAFALLRKGQPDAAIAVYRKAVELNPKYALRHNNLGFALIHNGRFEEARAAFRKALELDPKHFLARTNLTDCERLLALNRNLSAFLTGESKSTDAREQLDLGRLCRITKHYAAAVRFFAAAFDAAPRFAEDLQAGYRHHAACCAALAAAGQDQEAARKEDEECTRLRKQSLDWLRADLALCTKKIEKGTPQERATVQRTMRLWQQDADLAGIRDKDAVDKLPEVERANFRKLWDDVEALRQRAAASK